jgi:hypothetical protein
VVINPKRLKSLSVNYKSLSHARFKIKDAFRNEDELFEENIKIITTIESTGPKIACWTSRKALKLNVLITQRKR